MITISIVVASLLALALCGYVLLNAGAQHAGDEVVVPVAPLQSSMAGFNYLGRIKDLQRRPTPVLMPIVQEVRRDTPPHGTVLVAPEAVTDWAIDDKTDPDAVALDEQLRRKEASRLQRLNHQWFGERSDVGALSPGALTRALQQKWGA